MQSLSLQQQTERLQQAVGAMNQSDFTSAEAMACEVLASNERSTDAATLLGLIWMNSGQLERAEKQVKASLVIKAQQPGAYNILAGIRRKLGDLRAATEDYQEAVRLAPQFGEAWYNMGNTFKELGNLEEAERAWKEAIRIERTYPQARTSLGILLRDRGDLKEAAREFEQALKESPRYILALYHLGVTHRLLKNPHEALKKLRAALDINPALVQALYVIAGIEKEQGLNDAAVATLKKAIELSPEYGEAHKDLNMLLWEMGNTDEYLESYKRGISRIPGSVMLRHSHAEFLLRTGDIEEAEEKLRIALAKDAMSGDVNDALGRCLIRKGQYEDALKHHETAVRMDGTRDGWLINHAASLMYLGRFDEAISVLDKCDEERAAAGGLEQLRIAMFARCYDEVGDPRGQVINDYERFVKTRALPVPEGYETINDFNKDLLVELERLHVFDQRPIYQSLRANGTQTPGHLFDDAAPVIQKLKKALIANFQAYIEELDDDPSHPFLKRKGKNIGFNGGWSVRLLEQGYHASHIHGEGWISSAYYVSLPPEVVAGANEDKKAGHIHFGRPDQLPGEEGDPKFWIEPQEGYQAMFPSYIWHGTQPFKSDRPRISVAMDVTAN